MKYILTIFLLFTIANLTMGAQVGINNTDPKASLDINAISKTAPAITDGILIPRISAFPVSDPTVDQNGMLVYLEIDAGLKSKGFYYWDSISSKWIGIMSEWEKGRNADNQNLIKAKQADAAGSKVVITENGFVGIGTDSPTSELHIAGKRTGSNIVELNVQSSGGSADLKLTPAAPTNIGVPYIISAVGDGSNGFQISENTDVKLNILRSGKVRIADLNLAKNTGVKFPAAVYANTSGDLYVKGIRSPNDDLVVDRNSVTAQTISANGVNQEVTSATLYTYDITPTQDILLSVSYQLGVTVNQTNDTTKGPDSQHESHLYGAFFEVNGGARYGRSGENFSGGTDSFTGSYFINGNAFIKLVAGTSYTIALKGYIHSALKNDKGWRATFGSGTNNRVQILHQY